MGHHKHWIISTKALGYYVGLAISAAKVCGFMVQSHLYRSMGIIAAVTVASTTADAEVQPYAGLTALACNIFLWRKAGTKHRFVLSDLWCVSWVISNAVSGLHHKHHNTQHFELQNNIPLSCYIMRKCTCVWGISVFSLRNSQFLFLKTCRVLSMALNKTHTLYVLGKRATCLSFYCKAPFQLIYL